MPFGYHRQYLRIDASRGCIDRVPLDETVLRSHIGGSGLGARILLDEGGATADPLSPEAPLVFVFSPLVGSPLTTSAKFAVVSRSPLTGRFNDSLASSGFALAGKRCGCDAMVLVGRAPALSVLVIDDGDARIESADDVRGDACAVAEEKLRARYGADYRIASIGPAGEHGVRYATISHDGRHAGRGGCEGRNAASGRIRATSRSSVATCRGAHLVRRPPSIASLGRRPTS